MPDYTCYVCGKVFPRPKTLEIHIRSHTGEKPFRCNQCSKKFASERNMLLHHGRMHKQDQSSALSHSSKKGFGLKRTQSPILPPPVVVNAARKVLPHKCSKCNKSFSTNFALKRHIEKYHPRKVSHESKSDDEPFASTFKQDESPVKKDKRSKKKAKKEEMGKMFHAMLQEYFGTNPMTQMSNRYLKLEPLQHSSPRKGRGSSSDLDEAIRIQEELVQEKEMLADQARQTLLEARENLVKTKEELFALRERRQSRNSRSADEPSHLRDFSNACVDPVFPESEDSSGTESSQLTASGTKRKDCYDPEQAGPSGEYTSPSRQDSKKRKKFDEPDEQRNETEPHNSQEMKQSPQGTEADSQISNQSQQSSPQRIERTTPERLPIAPDRSRPTPQRKETPPQRTTTQNSQDRDGGNRSRELSPEQMTPTSSISGEQVIRRNEPSCSTNGRVAMNGPSTSRQSDHTRPSYSNDEDWMDIMGVSVKDENAMDNPDSDEDIFNPSLEEHTLERAIQDNFLANTFNKIKQQRKKDRNRTPDFVNGDASPRPLDLCAPSSSSGAMASQPRGCQSPRPGLGLGQTASGEIFQFFTDENGDQKFRCNMCNKTMNRSYHMKHQLVHMKAKPYRCEFCGRTFSQNSSLIQHRRLHTGEKPYECQYCDKRFPRKMALSNHMKKQHPDRQ